MKQCAFDFMAQPIPEEVRRMDEHDVLVWLAGFFEGEGCVAICAQKHKKYKTAYSLVVTVTQKEPEPLQVYSKLFGGWLYAYKANNGNQYWRWSQHGNGAMHCLQQLVPFMLFKKKRAAQLGIQFQQKLVVWNRDYGRRGYPDWVHQEREKFFMRMRELNQRGITHANPNPKNPGPRPGRARGFRKLKDKTNETQVTIQ